MDDFFDDIPEPQSERQPEEQQAEQAADEKKKRTVRNQKIFRAAVCVFAAVVLFFAGFFTYYLSLDKELRSLLWFKKKMQAEYYQPVSDEDFWGAAKDGVEGLLDDYSALYSAKDYDEVIASNQGSRLGVGLSFFYQTNCVYKVALNSPALAAGMEEGTFVTGVGKTESEISDTFTSDALDAAFGEIEDGVPFYLRTSPAAADDTEHTSLYRVEKKEYTESYAYYATNAGRWALIQEETGAIWKRYGEGISYLPEDVAYLKLVQFYGNAYESVQRAVQQYKADGKSKLIFDLRNNGGGSVDVMCSIASYLMKEGAASRNVAMSAQYRSGRTERYYAKANYYAEFFANSDIYVMANANSASASEALLGVMISYGTIEYRDIFLSQYMREEGESLVPVEGSCRTYGKGIMQTTFPNYATGEAAKLTTAKIFWPNGECIHGEGVNLKDDGVSFINVRASVEYGDPELRAAVEQIQNR